MASDTLPRARWALDQMLSAGIRPSVASVARGAGVARSTIYRHPELLETIAAARDRSLASHGFKTSGPSSETDGTGTEARLRDEVASLRTALDQLAQVVQVLSLDNDRLREELAEPSGKVTPVRPPRGSV